MQPLTDWEIPGHLVFEAGVNGLTKARITTPHADAEVYLHGAHLTHYQPRGHPPVLMMSGASQFALGEPIRGGIPVIFPWFGPRRDGRAEPPHGFARRREWTIEAADADAEDRVMLTLRLAGDDTTRAAWPGEFTLRFTITVGPSLRMELATTNTGTAPYQFEEALHTYFKVGDVRQVRVTGLEGREYLDATDERKRKRQGPGPITFDGETDRAYVNTPAECSLHDSALRRRITVEKDGANSTVVWNPWIAKAKRMPDFGDDEWPGMLCIETGNVFDNAVPLAPGATHQMTTTIGVEVAQP